MEPLDAWLAAAFDPGRLADALTQVDDEPRVDAAAESAQRELTECDRMLVRHRAALEAGADPQMVAEWTRDIRRRRDAAESELQAHRIEQPRPLDADEMNTLVASLGGLTRALRGADPDARCDLYRNSACR